jgi:uncharacterized protein
MASDPWHFPRPQLAKQYLDFFRTEVSNALILFQQRRYGKTEFCLHDLAPAAEAQGYSVVYANFWQARLSPIALLLHALEKSLERKSLSERVREFVTAPVTKLKLSGELAGAKAEAEIDLASLPQRANAELLLYLSDLTLRAAKRAKGKLLLLLDEVQELAEGDANDALVAALRTLLDTQRQAVKVVFTGSSLEGLTQMFSVAKAPFFHFGTRIDLPPLDTAFVRHLAGVFRERSRARVSVEEFLSAFEQLHANPYYFRKLIQPMAMPQALQSLRERVAEEQGFARVWESLQPLDRGVLAWLARGADTVFTKAALSFMGAASLQIVQSAVRRLKSKRLVQSQPGRGKYAIADAEFAVWLKGQGKLPPGNALAGERASTTRVRR